MHKIFIFLWEIDTISSSWSHRVFYQQESPHILELKLTYYKKFFCDIAETSSSKISSFLFHIPLEHAYLFLQVLCYEKSNSESFFYNKKIEIVIFDSAGLKDISNCANDITQEYTLLVGKISQYDKFIEIYNTLLPPENYGKNQEARILIRELDNNYKSQTQICSKHPRLKTYFPSESDARRENMTLEKYYQFCMSVVQMDWNRIQEANEDLVQLFCEYDSIHIHGKYADITFDISGMKARNSVIETNYPGCEVFSAPTLDGVNGWIEYHNPVYHHYSWNLLTWLRIEISHNVVQKFEIFWVEGKNARDEQEVRDEIMKHLEENPANKRVGEIAFGTNFFVPTWIKHILIAEKAFGMHFALGKSLPFSGTDNGNHDASMHWDLVRDMQDDTLVTFSKLSGESILVMKNGCFTQEACPRIYSYYKEVMK